MTPLGHSAWETFSALLAGRTIADRLAELPADIAPVDLVRAVGAVSFAQHSACDPSVELAERAGREALTMAGIAGREVSEVPCIIATSKGAVHALTAAADRHLPLAASHRKYPQPSTTTRPTDAHLAVTLGPHGYLTHHLRQRLGLGVTTHLVAACASSLIALHRARLALLSDEISNFKFQILPHQPSAPRRTLILTADAALLPSFIHAYHRLGVLAPLTAASYRGYPLDSRANGFMIAEAGAAVLLERIDDPNYLPPRHAIELIDTAEACEAFDLIRSDESLPALTRLANRLMQDRTIDLIHPHATGTEHHDTYEMNALEIRNPKSEIRNLKSEISNPKSPALTPHSALLASSSPSDLYAHKGALGHTLGTSGLISTVLACLCSRTQRRPPMPWLEHPIAPDLRAEPTARPIRTQAVFAAGFAGHTAGAILRTP